MTIHIEHPDYIMSKCEVFEPGDEFEVLDETPANCLKCIHFDEVQAAWEEYVEQPSKWGQDTHEIRLAEHDAFFAAAYTFIAKKYPF